MILTVFFKTLVVRLAQAWTPILSLGRLALSQLNCKDHIHFHIIIRSLHTCNIHEWLISFISQKKDWGYCFAREKNSFLIQVSLFSCLTQLQQSFMTWGLKNLLWQTLLFKTNWWHVTVGLSLIINIAAWFTVKFFICDKKLSREKSNYLAYSCQRRLLKEDPQYIFSLHFCIIRHHTFLW